MGIENKRNEINRIVRSLCDNQIIIYIDNDNIDISDVENKPWDKVHLLETETHFFLYKNHFIRIIEARFPKF